MNVCVSPYFSHTMRIHFSHVLGIAWISALRKISNQHLTLEYSIFPYFSRTTGIHFPCLFGAILLMWKLIKTFYFRSYFDSNICVKLFTKEVNLFCCWARAIICISGPFLTEVWKYIQYWRVGSASVTIYQCIWQLEFV